MSINSTSHIKRESKYELLRIVAMIMIIFSHMACHGVQNVLDNGNAYKLYFEGSIVNKWIVSCLNVGGEVGVALFFIITGFFCVRKNRITVKKVVLESIFYGWLSIIAFIIIYLCNRNIISLNNDILFFLIKALIVPISGGAWWYVTTYVFLVLCVPVINPLICKLNKKGVVLLVITSWFFLYFMGKFCGSQFYYFQRGLFFYIVGAYLQLYGKKKLENKTNNIVLLILFILFWVGSACLFYELANVHNDPTTIGKFIVKLISSVNTAFFVPGSSITLFCLFMYSRIGYNRIINLIATTTFGIYLIHDSVVFRQIVWRGIFKIDTLYLSKYFLFVAVFYCIIVFSICAICDMFRKRFIEPYLLMLYENFENKLYKKCVCEIKK